jgi:hypothetical protein
LIDWYQIEFFSHKCVAFFIWPKKKVLEFIGIKIRLKLFKIYIEKYIISSWFVPFLFDRKKKQVLEFIGIKIRWKLSKLNNLLILVCVVYWATLFATRTNKNKTLWPIDFLFSGTIFWNLFVLKSDENFLKLNNLLILVCVVYWATLWCNPNTQKKQPNDLLIFYFRLQADWYHLSNWVFSLS